MTVSSITVDGISGVVPLSLVASSGAWNSKANPNSGHQPIGSLVLYENLLGLYCCYGCET